MAVTVILRSDIMTQKKGNIKSADYSNILVMLNRLDKALICSDTLVSFLFQENSITSTCTKTTYRQKAVYNAAIDSGCTHAIRDRLSQGRGAILTKTSHKELRQCITILNMQ